MYFTKAGARKLAHYVEREITRLLAARSAPIALPIEPATPDANVLPNLNLGHSLDALVELGESFLATDKRMRVFAGYSGWSPGQLEAEMKREAWVAHPATVELVFDLEPGKLWQEILRQKGWRYRLLADGPEDLTWN